MWSKFRFSPCCFFSINIFCLSKCSQSFVFFTSLILFPFFFRVEKVYLERYCQALDQCHVHTIEIICTAKANGAGRQTPPVRIIVETPYRRCFKVLVVFLILLTTH